MEKRNYVKAEAEQKYHLAAVSSIGQYKVKVELNGLFDSFLSHLHESAKVLEIGPGFGSFAKECEARGLDYIGIEPSKTLSEELQKAGLKIIRDAVPSIDLQDNLFDLVHSRDFVEHLADYKEVVKYFDEALRVLKPGGYVSTLAPNYSMIKDLFFQY